MNKKQLFYSAVAVLLAGVCGHTDADAGTVSITNNFANTVRVGIYAGASESQVTVYTAESRTYTTFATRSIDKISVVNVAGGANAPLGSYSVSNPSSTANYNVTVAPNGNVAVTPALIP